MNVVEVVGEMLILWKRKKWLNVVEVVGEKYVDAFEEKKIVVLFPEIESLVSIVPEIKSLRQYCLIK